MMKLNLGSKTSDSLDLLSLMVLRSNEALSVVDRISLTFLDYN